MSEIDIYRQLNADRDLAISRDSSFNVKAAAWDRIDHALDELNATRLAGQLASGEIIETIPVAE